MYYIFNLRDTTFKLSGLKLLLCKRFYIVCPRLCQSLGENNSMLYADTHMENYGSTCTDQNCIRKIKETHTHLN